MMARQTPNQIPWDPQSTVFPTRTELPTIPGAPEQAAWVWGEDDNANGDDVVGPNANKKCSIEHWAQRGIAGRGILLDFREYAKKHGINYDAYDTCEISFQQLVDCGKEQGIDIRPEAQGGDIKIGDILFVRSGWVETYYQKSVEELKVLEARGLEELKFVGLSQEQAILDWLHDSYFAAVAGDAPTFEAWPTNEAYHLHEYILSLWGMPLGEMLQLEKLAEKCRERKKWTFFFTSAPANCPIRM
ncbi:hypothetical protein G7Z17_g264 [Cylindrodendrum hubeiense]|uniref:Cyclase n=1 Tax=Cylindrodendrum hubeiense TaxID=595255 RepID=A0A9P5HQ57_9HYPO|nr:hypothetical protein G7Z17_g264 [Cylindrodendrum hubeiense]